ncbi:MULTISPECIES: MucB/RseB C-terminal domain-containing protein [unclassified Thioalkalivibrio]|uniref:MucB/RseB C-terminal domain-containing protein n=1 Tax=unclassified Thioalkalivibrio TaxID=2621013 RepID=UPI0003613A55|nr:MULTISPECIES: MucB/RseB C-terminal domain-containing protein [unclassified Thioalkalivibrio]
MWRGLPLVLAATALCLPAQVLADEVSPSEWLERMTTSLHAESYQGTFVLQRDDRIDTIRVVHVADDGGYRERLETLTGAEREILRSVDRLSAIKGARGASGDGAQSPLGPAGAPVSLLETHDLYALKIQGLDRVAGYPCTLIMARARDALRYSHRYCLHMDSALPLLSELYDPKGKLLERLAFTDLELSDEIAESELEPTTDQAEHIEVRADRGHKKPQWDDDNGLGGWKFGELPPGFQAVAATERSLGNGDEVSRHFVLSDGLASVSVYVEPADGEKSFEGATRAGATHAAARVMAGHQVTAVGDVPHITVQQVLDAVYYQGAAGE